MKTVIARAEEAGAARVERVVIEAGELREFVDAFVQKYWGYASAGTVCEGAKVELVRIPAQARCGKCARVYPLDMNDLMNNNCPQCGFENGELVSGRELRIKGIEISVQ